MGLLTVGTPLQFSEIKEYADLIRKKGIKQFLNIYKNYKNNCCDCLKWGDEVEFNIIKFDHLNKRAYLLLKADQLLPKLQEPELNHEETTSLWRPEYANYMIEGTPGAPYEHDIRYFNSIEANMKLRRKQVQDLLGKDECILSLTVFPLLGCKNFTWPQYETTPTEGITRSLFFPDQAIFPGHPRFSALSRNIRERRKSKVVINVPIFKDKNTPQPFIEDLNQYNDIDDPNSESKLASKPDHIYLDAMGFGMGCSCLQMTFQAQNIAEARHLYDQLTPLTPIFLALSAAAPIWRGYLSDVDCRWNVISGSVDDRTREELGEIPLKENKFRINKSRYDSIDCYLSELGAKYNDINLVKDDEIYKTLIDNDIDHLLAQHIAHLFIRDPISVFKEKIHINDEEETDHFENIQSTNWQTMRFKPPPMNTNIGWRVEFRPTELQLTDFENAAFTTFLVLFTRVILSFQLNLLIPISKVDENMQKAQKRNACLEEKFYFRKSIFTNGSAKQQINSNLNGNNTDEQEFTLMTIDEIVNGSSEFPGLISLIKDYLSSLDIDVYTQCTINQYLKLIECRASGRLMTTATWIRSFVTKHPNYKHDSRVSEEIAYDLLSKINLISTGKEKCRELLCNLESKSSMN